VFGLARNTVLAPQFPCDRVPRLDGARSGHILGQSSAETFDGGLFNVVGSVKIRFPGSEGDYISALFLLCRGARSNREGRTFLHSMNTGGNLHKFRSL
jgi:hypothetical protein